MSKESKLKEKTRNFSKKFREQLHIYAKGSKDSDISINLEPIENLIKTTDKEIVFNYFSLKNDRDIIDFARYADINIIPLFEKYIDHDFWNKLDVAVLYNLFKQFNLTLEDNNKIYDRYTHENCFIYVLKKINKITIDDLLNNIRLFDDIWGTANLNIINCLAELYNQDTTEFLSNNLKKGIYYKMTCEKIFEEAIKLADKKIFNFLISLPKQDAFFNDREQLIAETTKNALLRYDFQAVKFLALAEQQSIGDFLSGTAIKNFILSHTIEDAADLLVNLIYQLEYELIDIVLKKFSLEISKTLLNEEYVHQIILAQLDIELIELFNSKFNINLFDKVDNEYIYKIFHEATFYDDYKFIEFLKAELNDPLLFEEMLCKDNFDILNVAIKQNAFKASILLLSYLPKETQKNFLKSNSTDKNFTSWLEALLEVDFLSLDNFDVIVRFLANKLKTPEQVKNIILNNKALLLQMQKNAGEGTIDINDLKMLIKLGITGLSKSTPESSIEDSPKVFCSDIWNKHILPQLLETKADLSMLNLVYNGEVSATNLESALGSLSLSSDTESDKENIDIDSDSDIAPEVKRVKIAGASDLKDPSQFLGL